MHTDLMTDERNRMIANSKKTIYRLKAHATSKSAVSLAHVHPVIRS